MAASYQGFESFGKITIGDKDITFTSSFTASQTRDAAVPVYTMSNAISGSGFVNQQFGFNISMTMPVSAIEEFRLRGQDISADASTQLIFKGNIANANGTDITFEGTTLIFNNLTFLSQSHTYGEGSAAVHTVNFFAPSHVIA